MREYRKLYKAEYKLAMNILANEQGILDWSEHDYEAFIFKGPFVSLVFYPHKTSAGNYHIRVRDQNSKNPNEAARIMEKLDKESGFNCTFSHNRHPLRDLERFR